MTEYLIVDHLSRKDIRYLFSRIEVDPITHCWNWIGASLGEYGLVHLHSQRELAHRLIYAWIAEPIPKGKGQNILQLDHITCDNKKCCNPAHLRLVLPRFNVLRSNSITAINARKTHCIHGHPLPTETRDIGGRRIGRDCKVCRLARQKAKRNGPRREELLARCRQLRAIKRAKSVILPT